VPPLPSSASGRRRRGYTSRSPTLHAIRVGIPVGFEAWSLRVWGAAPGDPEVISGVLLGAHRCTPRPVPFRSTPVPAVLVSQQWEGCRRHGPDVALRIAAPPAITTREEGIMVDLVASETPPFHVKRRSIRWGRVVARCVPRPLTASDRLTCRTRKWRRRLKANRS